MRIIMKSKFSKYPFLSLKKIEMYEDQMERKGVSEVARSKRGFLTAYREAGGHPEALSPEWIARRDGFIARHMAQVIVNDEPLWLRSSGDPSRRHLALIAWAYSPQPRSL
jgi:hypothetical protein